MSRLVDDQFAATREFRQIATGFVPGKISLEEYDLVPPPGHAGAQAPPQGRMAVGDSVITTASMCVSIPATLYALSPFSGPKEESALIPWQAGGMPLRLWSTPCGLRRVCRTGEDMGNGHRYNEVLTRAKDQDPQMHPSTENRFSL
jgi:hypothetical protein